jgi:hypothetical protein
MKTIDREIRKMVQSMESEIPQAVEESIMEALGGMEPAPRSPIIRRRPIVYYGAAAAAIAAVLLVVMMFLFPLFHHDSHTAEAGEVWVQDARVEGQPANTVYVNPIDPGITIVWIEKINKEN